MVLQGLSKVFSQNKIEIFKKLIFSIFHGLFYYQPTHNKRKIDFNFSPEQTIKQKSRLRNILKMHSNRIKNSREKFSNMTLLFRNKELENEHTKK